MPRRGIFGLDGKGIPSMFPGRVERDGLTLLMFVEGLSQRSFIIMRHLLREDFFYRLQPFTDQLKLPLKLCGGHGCYSTRSSDIIKRRVLRIPKLSDCTGLLRTVTGMLTCF